jgi:type III secretion HrpO family protein
MNQDELTALTNSALFLVLRLSMAPVAIATLVGVLVSLLQAATQIQDQTAPFLAKMCVVMLTLVLFGPWMAHELTVFTTTLFDYMPSA